MPTIWIGNRTSDFHIAMWIWAYDLKTQENIDTMIAWATGRMTDLFIFAIDDSVNPKTWLGTGTLGSSNATSIGGKTPWQYTYDAAHAAGIRVHAWLWLTHFAYWGGTAGIDSDIPNNGTYNDAGIWNFHSATARTEMVNQIVDFVGHNSVDGLNLNHEDTTANITEADFTSFCEELRAAVPDKEISLCTGANFIADDFVKINTDAMMAANTIDTVTLMGYYDAIQKKREYVDSLAVAGSRVYAGVGIESDTVHGSDVRYKLLQLIADGYTRFAFFCWGNSFDSDSDMRAIIDEYRASTLAATQAAITSVSVTPGTSWTINVGGSDQTTTYASVSDHTYSGPLKAHIEGVIGSTNPAIIYYRANSTTTEILVGDFEP